MKPTTARSVYRYGGESVGKKLARLDFWVRSKLWLGAQFFETDHLVLASNEGGDISVLRGLGVRSEHIVAIDIDQEAAATCQRKFPDVGVRVGDVGRFAERAGKKYGVCFLDFCGWGSDSELNALSQVARYATTNESILGYAFMRGREPKRVSAVLQEQAVVERKYRTTFSVEGEHGLRMVTADGRSQRIFNHLIDRMLPARKGTMPMFQTFYHSTCSWRQGVPMMLVAKWVYAECGGTEKQKFIDRWSSFGRQWVQAVEAVGQAELDGASRDELSNGIVDRKLMLRWGRREWMGPSTQVFDRELLTVQSLLDAADMCERENIGAPHLLLNIRPARLAAFRAHRTMGTYGKTEKVA